MASHILARRRLYRFLRQWVGYIIAVAALVWVFRDVDISQVLRQIPRLNWAFVALALFIDLFSYISRGLRWRLLLAPIAPLSLFRATQAVYAGQFANQILPMRLGEVVRTYIVSNWLSLEFARVAPSVFVERVMDGLWSAVGLALIAALVPVPSKLVKAGVVLGILIAVSAGIFVLTFVTDRKRGGRDNNRPGSGAEFGTRSFLQDAGEGIRAIGFTRLFYEALGLSFLFLLLQTVTFWLLIHAYGVELPFLAGAIVYLVVHIGTIIPNAPANIGLFQFFCIMGLTIFHVNKTVAAGFSIVVFLLLSLPLWLVGFFALSRSGTTLSSIRDQTKGEEKSG